jgi:AhpC/TSA family
MQKRIPKIVTSLLAGALAVGMASPLLAQSQSGEASAGMPTVGDMAPDFTLKYFDGSDRKDVKLSDFRGKKNVIVAFYVFAFTGG